MRAGAGILTKLLRILRREGARGVIRRAERRLERTWYACWVWTHRLTSQDQARIRQQVPLLSHRPLISVIVTASPLSLAQLRRSLNSVLKQLYPHWEIYVVDSIANDARIAAILTDIQSRDTRLHLIRNSSNDPLDAVQSALELARGEFIALLQANDELAADALWRVAEAVNDHPTVALLYSDEDKLNRWGWRVQPQLKPDWSLHLLRSHNYIGQLTVIRTDLVRSLGGFRPALAGAHEYDLILRAVERLPSPRIHHIRRVLCHRWTEVGTGTQQSTATSAAAGRRQALEEHLLRANCAAVVHPVAGQSDVQRIVYRAPSCRVSVIVPTRDRLELLQRCVTGLLARTDYPDLELILLDNGSVETETRRYLAAMGQRSGVQVIRVDAPFNFSVLCNVGAQAATGDLLCLFNNDIEITQPGWLRELAGLALQPEVGAAGPLLRYPDGRIQHMGIRVDPPWPRLIGDGQRDREQRRSGGLQRVRNVAAVTGGCLVTRHALFDAMGGLDEALAVAYNDVDFCLSLRRAGYWIVWTPFAELKHVLMATRRAARTPARRAQYSDEAAYYRRKWQQWARDDPFQPER